MNKYRFRRLSPDEFRAMMNKAGMSINDFLFLTGRHSAQIMKFLGGDEDQWRPTMADILVVETAGMSEKNKSALMRIAGKYLVDEATTEPRRTRT